jgi:hypothetical protein
VVTFDGATDYYQPLIYYLRGVVLISDYGEHVKEEVVKM